MTDLPRKHLKGEQNQCPTCGTYFTTNRGFERHRGGKYGNSSDPRRCIDPATRGMHLDSDGFWRRDGSFSHK